MTDFDGKMSATVIRLDQRSFTDWEREVGPLLPLMDHQDAAVNKALARLSTEATAGVVCVPTGGGKTRIGAEVVTRLVNEYGFRVLWLAHKTELADQAVEAFIKVAAGRRCPLRIGRFQAGGRKATLPVDVVVASIPTVNRASNLYDLLRFQQRFDLVVVDECHHTVARTWRTLVVGLRDRFPSLRTLGLSATPFRQDSVEDNALRQLFDSTVIHEVGATELIENRVLAVPHFAEVDTFELLDFAGSVALENEDAEFSASQLQRIADLQARNQLMVDVYLANRQAFGPTIFFTCTIRHCEQIVRMLHAAGISRARAVHGDTRRLPFSQRNDAIKAFRKGQLDVLVSAMLLTEGTDLPKTRTILMARPTRSPILFRQMIGRGLRGPRVGGTPECNIVLFRDTFSDHATDSLAKRLAWMAGLDNLKTFLRVLDARDLAKEVEKAKLQDPLLLAERARRLRQIEEKLLALVADAGLTAADEDRRLDGWWELALNPTVPPLILPGFHGLDDVKRLIESVIESVRGGQVLAPGWYWPFIFDSASIYVRALAFAQTARRHRVEPRWVDIDSVDVSRTFELPQRGDHPDYEETYQTVGRDLLRKDVDLLIRRSLRARLDWSLPDADLWKKHVTSLETWVRLVKRSEEFFPAKEWRELVAQARGAFFAARPDD